MIKLPYNKDYINLLIKTGGLIVSFPSHSLLVKVYPYQSLLNGECMGKNDRFTLVWFSLLQPLLPFVS